MALVALERKCKHCGSRGPHKIVGTQPDKPHPVVISSSPKSTYERGTAADNMYKVIQCACGNKFNARATGMEKLFS